MAQQAINVNPGAISKELSQPLNSKEPTETQSREGETLQPGEASYSRKTSYSSKTLEGPPGICSIADIEAQVEANTDDEIDIDDYKWSSFAEAKSNKKHTKTSNVAKKMKGALAKISIANASEPSAVKIPQNTPTNTSVVTENDASPVAVQQNIDIRATERKRVHLYEKHTDDEHIKHHQRRPSPKASPVVISQDSEDTAPNAPEGEEPLPARWRAEINENGCVYYPVNAATAPIASQLGNKMTKLSIASASEASPVVIPQNPQIITRVVVVNDASPVTMRQNAATNVPKFVVKDVPPVVIIPQRTEINIEPRTRVRHRTSTISEKTLAKRSNEEHGFIFLGILLAIAAIVIDIFAISEGALPTDRILVEVLKAFLSAISFGIIIFFFGDSGFRCYEKTSKKSLAGLNVFLWAICAYFDAMELIERGRDGHLNSGADSFLILEFAVSSLGFTISFGILLVKMCETMRKCICKLISSLVCVVAIISIILLASAIIGESATSDCDSYYENC